MNDSRQLASRLRQAVQGCTLHLHGPVQAWAAVEQACLEGKASREEVAQYVIKSCTNRIEELLAAGIAHDDLRILKERKTRKFVERLLLDREAAPITQTPILSVGIIITNEANQQEIALLKRETLSCGWELPGGVTKIGETAESTAYRYALEGTGLRLKSLRLLGIYSNHAYENQSQTATLVFLATGRGVLNTNNTECVVKYFSVDNYPELAFDDSKILADFFISAPTGKLSYA